MSGVETGGPPHAASYRREGNAGRTAGLGASASAAAFPDWSATALSKYATPPRGDFGLVASVRTMSWFVRMRAPKTTITASCPFSSLVLGSLLATLACGCSGPSSEGDEGAAELTVSSESGAYEVTLESSPEREPVRGHNDIWLTVVSTDDGGAVSDLTLTMVPFMPAMGHGNGSKPTGEAVGGGVYEFRDVNLTMPGLWELRTGIVGPKADSVTFAFSVR